MDRAAKTDTSGAPSSAFSMSRRAGTTGPLSITTVVSAPGILGSGPLLGKGPRSAAVGMAAWDELGAGGGRAARLNRARRDAALIVGVYLHGFESSSLGTTSKTPLGGNRWEAIRADSELPFSHLLRQDGATVGVPDADAGLASGVALDSGSADAPSASPPPPPVWPRQLALQRRLGGLLWPLTPTSALRRVAAAEREVSDRTRANQRELERAVANVCRANDRAARAALRKVQAAEERERAKVIAQTQAKGATQWNVEQVRAELAGLCEAVCETHSRVVLDCRSLRFYGSTPSLANFPSSRAFPLP